MAVPTVVGVGTVVSDVGAITPGLPSGWAEDDILLLFCETSGSQSITCSGYTVLLEYGTSAANGSRVTVMWKRAGTSESDPTTSDSGDHQLGAIMAVRGCIAAGSPFVSYTAGSTSTSGSTKTWAADFKTYIADALIVAGLTSMTDGYTGAGFSSWANSSLTNIVEQIDTYTDVGNGGGLGVVTATKASAGSLGTFTVTDAYPTAGVTSASFMLAMVPSTVPTPFVRARGPYTDYYGTGAINLPMPNVVGENDIVLAFVETNNESVTVTGYTEAGSSPASNAGTNPTRLSVFYKRAGSSEGAAAVSDSGNHQIGGIVVIGGAVTSGDPFDVTTSSSGGTGSSISIGGTTSTVGNTLVVAAVASTSNNGYNTADVMFSSWANSNLTDFGEIVDAGYAGVGTGGAVGVACGNLASASNYGSTTVTGAASAEYATWSGAIKRVPIDVTLSADSASLTLAGANVDFGRLFAADSAMTLTGASASFARQLTLSVSAGSFALSGQSITPSIAMGMTADAGALTLGSETADLISSGTVLEAEAGSLTLAKTDFSVLVPTPETFTLAFIVDLCPQLTGNYQRYAQRLTVDGRSVPVRSWSWEESDRSLAGTLQVELADVADRQYVTKDSKIVFDLGTWEGSAYRWESLVDSGRLQRTDYAVSRNGIGPADAFTFTGYSEMDDRLNSCPDNNVVLYDPARHTLSASDFEGIYDFEGNYYPPTVTARSGQTMHTLLHDVFVTRCGFASVATNIPDFPVPIAEFGVGQPYVGTIGGIIGMFEPMFTATDDGGLDLFIVDGTTSVVPGMPAPREVTTSKALSMGVGSDLARAKALMISVNQERYSFDYFTDRVVIENDDDIGKSGDFSSEFVTVQTITTYRDYYRASNADRPVKTEMRSQAKDTYKNGTELIAQSSEHLYYDGWGRLNVRIKTVDAKVPDPDDAFAPAVRRVSEEVENLTWKTHPYNPKQYYRSRREVVKSGLVYVDSTNQQLGEDYVRDAVTVYRAGNVTEDMSGDWRKISTSVEEVTPLRNGRVRIKTIELDHLQNQYANQDEQERDGEVGVNVFVNEQQKIVIFEPGESNVTGAVDQVNMGELPLTMAVSLGRRLLRRRLFAPERVAFTVPGADLSIEKGSVFTAKGRNGEDLGTYIVEARSIKADAGGVTMNVQARSAENS